MGRTHHRTPEVTIWSGARGLYHACCDCGWDDKPRWLQSTARRLALAHANQTGHQPTRPLFVSLLPTDTAWRPSRLAMLWRRATAWPVIALMPLLLIPLILWLAPHARADAIQDVAYLSTLDQFGVTYSSEPAAIALGQGVCEVLDDGITPRRVDWVVADAGGYSPRDAEIIVGAAVGSYCQHHAGALGIGSRMV